MRRVFNDFSCLLYVPPAVVTDASALSFQNANLRESNNANREPLHPRLAPLIAGRGRLAGTNENRIMVFLQPVHSRRLHVPLQSVHS